MSFDARTDTIHEELNQPVITELPNDPEQMDEAPKPKRPRSPNKAKLPAAGANGQAEAASDMTTLYFLVYPPEGNNAIPKVVVETDERLAVGNAIVNGGKLFRGILIDPPEKAFGGKGK